MSKPVASDALWCLDSRLFEQKALCHDKQAADGMQISASFPMVSLLLYVNWQILQIKLKYTPDKLLIKKMNVEGSM